MSNNRAYYLKVFERLDTTGKNTWNWAAFFFPLQWMAYRKMYLYSFLGLIFIKLLEVFTACFIIAVARSMEVRPLVISAAIIWFLILACILLPLFALLGFFGNRLYYRIIKKRIAKGYNLPDNFHPTSIPCALSCGLSGILYYISDKISQRRYFNSLRARALTLTDLGLKPSDKNIENYLVGSQKKTIAQWIIDIFVCIVPMFYYVSFSLSLPMYFYMRLTGV